MERAAPKFFRSSPNWLQEEFDLPAGSAGGGEKDGEAVKSESG